MSSKIQNEKWRLENEGYDKLKVEVEEKVEQPAHKRVSGKDILGGLAMTALAAVGVAYPIYATIDYIRTGRKHQKELHSVYGNNVFEGSTINTGKKLWDMHSNWEKSNKKNFDKIKRTVKGLTLDTDEWYMIGNAKHPKTKVLMTEVMQFTDNFWHQELM